MKAGIHVLAYGSLRRMGMTLVCDAASLRGSRDYVAAPFPIVSLLREV